VEPTVTNGKICYVEIPTDDVARSSAFYEAVFGWGIRTRDDGSVAFDDGVEVSGTWVTGRTAHQAGGLTIYVMVDSVDETAAKVVANGGVIVQPPGKRREITAQFTDPYGNVVGLYEQRS
jgi:predicted enzyme related to lactoylglutathione lyase